MIDGVSLSRQEKSMGDFPKYFDFQSMIDEAVAKVNAVMDSALRDEVISVLRKAGYVIVPPGTAGDVTTGQLLDGLRIALTRMEQIEDPRFSDRLSIRALQAVIANLEPLRHDPRCISLTGSEFKDMCDCKTLRIIDAYDSGQVAAPEHAPIPEAATLTVPWPSTRPLGLSVSANGVKDAWDSIIAPLAKAGPQSVELRILMAVVRSVYDGMHGISGPTKRCSNPECPLDYGHDGPCAPKDWKPGDPS